MMRKKLKRQIVSACCIMIGCFLLLYPWVSCSWQESRAVSAVAEYKREKKLHTTAMAKARFCAQRYNAALLQETAVLVDPFRTAGQKNQQRLYEEIQKEIGREILGTVEIPVLQLKLPVYMGSTEKVLQKGAGHLEGTSLPIGGENTHAVLTGHTGLHTARLFTDLEALTTGDLFYLDILGEQLTYRVEDIRVVVPEDTQALVIQKGRDLVTLLTCTPYGINDHRLLVQGVRCQDADQTQKVTEKRSGSQWMKAYVHSLVCGGVAVFLLWCLMTWKKGIYKA